MARVLLVSPPHYKEPVSYKEMSYPLGLAFIAASLRQARHEVAILDCVAECFDEEEIVTTEDDRLFIRHGMSEAQVRERIQCFQPDIVGVTNNFTTQFLQALSVCNIAKEISEHILTVIGGAHPTAVAEEIISRYQAVDFVVKNEGEIPLRQLADLADIHTKCAFHSDIAKVPGLTYRTQEGAVLSNPRVFIMDLDRLPFPAYDLLPLSSYVRETSSFFELGESRGERWAAISISRGCAYNCDFCMAELMEGRRVRAVGLDTVRHWLSFLQELEISDVYIEDNNLLQTKHLRNLLTLLKETGFHYQIANGIDPTFLKPETIDLLGQTGCYKVYYPVETGTADILKTFKYSRKNIDRYRQMLESTCANVQRLTSYGIEVLAGYMMGFPGESIEQMKATAEMAQRLYEVDSRLVKTIVFCVTPLPGTTLYAQCMRGGLIPLEFDWNKNPELFSYERAKIGPDKQHLALVEQLRVDTLRRCNSSEMADFLTNGKSWRSQSCLSTAVRM